MNEIEELKEELYIRMFNYCDDIVFSVPNYDKDDNYVKFIEKPFFDKQLFECLCDMLIDKKNLLKTENFKEKKAHGFIQKIILKPFYFVARFIAIILIPKILSCILLPATFIFYPKTGAMYTQANPKSK